MYFAQISENTWILLAGQCVLALGMIIKAVVDGYNRIQDRLDRESLANATKNEFEKVIQEQKQDGKERVKTIIAKVETVEKKVETVETKADAAYVAGNGNQERFATVALVLKDHAKKLDNVPIKVEVVSDEHNPVHTVVEEIKQN